MYAAKFAPVTALTVSTRPHPTAAATTGQDTAKIYRPAPSPADVIDAWARHADASNGFGDAGAGDGQRPYVLPYWKSR